MIRVVASAISVPESAFFVESLFLGGTVAGFELTILTAIFRRLQARTKANVSPPYALDEEGVVKRITKSVHSRRFNGYGCVNAQIVEGKGS
jgi:hypothetical protein